MAKQLSRSYDSKTREFEKAEQVSPNTVRVTTGKSGLIFDSVEKVEYVDKGHYEKTKKR